MSYPQPPLPTGNPYAPTTGSLPPDGYAPRHAEVPRPDETPRHAEYAPPTETFPGSYPGSPDRPPIQPTYRPAVEDYWPAPAQNPYQDDANDPYFEPAYQPSVIYRDADGVPAGSLFDDGPDAEAERSRWPIGPRLFLGIAGVVVVLAAACTALVLAFGPSARSVTHSIGDQTATARKDVTIASCTADPATGYMAATVRIQNHGQHRASYLLDVTFTPAGSHKTPASVIATANSVLTGASTTVPVTSLVPAKGTYTCTIAGVTKL
jgi:hypothetical protein